jgi:hypothetical protein
VWCISDFHFCHGEGTIDFRDFEDAVVIYITGTTLFRFLLDLFAPRSIRIIFSYPEEYPTRPQGVSVQKPPPGMLL